MNLAIESIIRDKSVQNLFQTPTTLGVWNGLNRFYWITLTKEGDRILVSHYDLENIDMNDPEGVEFTIAADEIFKPKVVIPEGFRPISFLVESVDTDLNNYNKPMPREHYETYHREMFNPDRHKKYKRAWLWAMFMKRFGEEDTEQRRYINDCVRYNDPWELRYQAEEEMGYIAMTSPLWHVWENFSRKLLIKEQGAAGELVFASLFEIDGI